MDEATVEREKVGVGQRAEYLYTPATIYLTSIGDVQPYTGITGTVTVKNNFLDPTIDFLVGFLMPVYDPDNDVYTLITLEETSDTIEYTWVYGSMVYDVAPPAKGSESSYDIETYTIDWEISDLTKPYTYGCLAFVAELVNTAQRWYTVDEVPRVIGILYSNIDTSSIGYENYNLYDTALYGDQFTVKTAAEITGFSLTKA